MTKKCFQFHFVSELRVGVIDLVHNTCTINYDLNLGLCKVVQHDCSLIFLFFFSCDSLLFKSFLSPTPILETCVSLFLVQLLAKEFHSNLLYFPWEETNIATVKFKSLKIMFLIFYFAMLGINLEKNTFAGLCFIFR